MWVSLRLDDRDIERIAAHIAEHLAVGAITNPGWLDVAGAAAHLAVSENAIRALVKRNRIPYHRMENGRLRFSMTELDRWVRTGTCESPHVDLP
jgi:excisionase family DNA binding protein